MYIFSVKKFQFSQTALIHIYRSKPKCSRIMNDEQQEKEKEILKKLKKKYQTKNHNHNTSCRSIYNHIFCFCFFFSPHTYSFRMFIFGSTKAYFKCNLVTRNNKYRAWCDRNQSTDKISTKNILNVLSLGKHNFSSVFHLNMMRIFVVFVFWESNRDM